MPFAKLDTPPSVPRSVIVALVVLVVWIVLGGQESIAAVPSEEPRLLESAERILISDEAEAGQACRAVEQAPENGCRVLDAFKVEELGFAVRGLVFLPPKHLRAIAVWGKRIGLQLVHRARRSYGGFKLGPFRNCFGVADCW